jgi:hypothetical protein
VDRDYAHCTREQHAGTLEKHGEGQTFAHWLRGPCRCGKDHREPAPRAAWDRGSPREVEATHDYTDEGGRVLFQAVRFRPKAFKQRRPNGAGGWIWDLEGTRLVLYRLPELLRAVAAGDPVWIVEGEKDAEAMHAAGYVATCNPMGAGKWRDEFRADLEGADVRIVRDKDEPGHKHARQVAESLLGIAESVRVVEAKEGKDAADHLAAGFGVDDFVEVYELCRVPLSRLLDQVVTALTDYLVLPNQHAAIAITLWLAHTHAFEQSETTPYLAVLSPEKRCGKSRVFDVCAKLVRRPWVVTLPSEAVVFRQIDLECPTLLLDEADAIFSKGREHEGLRALLNAGHRAGATVPRCVGEGAKMVVKSFPTYCPKAIAGIGELPETIVDRSIIIRLRRKARTESVKRFRQRDAGAELAPLRAGLEKWALSAVALRDARPAIPEQLEDRAADSWEPLLAISDLAGGDWPIRARAAAVALSAPAEDGDASLGVKLLSDIRTAIGAASVIFTRDLCDSLNALDERPWGAFRGGKGIDARALAGKLKSYGIRSRDVRLGSDNAKGYKADDFADAWGRYCPGPLSPQSVRDTVTTEQIRVLTSNSGLALSPIENEANPAESLGCHPCHPSDPGEGRRARSGGLEEGTVEDQDPAEGRR